MAFELSMRSLTRLFSALGLALALLGASLYVPEVSADTPEDLRIVRVYYSDVATRSRIIVSFEAALLETRYEDGYHVLEVSQSDLEKLKAAGLKTQEDPFYVPRAQRLPGFSCYESVDETFVSAQALAGARPNLVDWKDIGNSWEKDAGLGGEDINVLVLTNSMTVGEKPKLLLTCALHAREYATAQLCLDFAEYLVDGYGVDADATWLLDYHEIHMVLQANPDGRRLAELGWLWRKNTNQNYCGTSSVSRGADLNRNFPFQWNCCGGSSGSVCSNTYRGTAAMSEPEVSAIVDYGRLLFLDQRGEGLEEAAPIDATGVAIDVHSYGELVLWPWGHQSSLAPNGESLQTLGRKFSYWNGYWPEQAIGLYPTDGTTDDFFYGDLGVAAFTFELGTAFFESCQTYTDTVFPENLPSLVYAAKVVRAPYVTPAGPDVSLISLSAPSAIVGETVAMTATLDDTRYSNANGSEPTHVIAEAQYFVDVPPWAGGSGVNMTLADGSSDSSVESFTADLSTGGLSPGSHILFVRGRDADGNWGAVTAIFLDLEQAAALPGLSMWGRASLAFLILVSFWFSRQRAELFRPI